jgi:hypothetical protein
VLRTAVATVGGRHFGAAVAVVFLPPVPLLERAPLTAGSRLTTAKHTAAMAWALSGAKVSSGQCLRGFGARSWRENDHGRRQCWGAGERCAAGWRGHDSGAIGESCKRGAAGDGSPKWRPGGRDTGAVWRGPGLQNCEVGGGGRGLWGRGHTFVTKCGDALAARPAAGLSKNNNCGWCFLEVVGWNCC